MAISTLNPQWFLYMPSLYMFAVYEAFFAAIELNKIFKLEQTMYFLKEYQNKKFKLPEKKRKIY